MDRLIFRTINREASIEVSQDHTKIAIFYQRGVENHGKIIEIDIESLWDMLKDALSSIDIDKTHPGLFRRKCEAIEANTYSKIGGRQ